MGASRSLTGAGWLLFAAALICAVACLAAWFRFGFRWVLAWWLALGLSAAWAGWRVMRPTGPGGKQP